MCGCLCSGFWRPHGGKLPWRRTQAVLISEAPGLGRMRGIATCRLRWLQPGVIQMPRAVCFQHHLLALRPSCCFLGWILQSSGCVLPECFAVLPEYFAVLRGGDRGAPWGLAVGRAGKVWSGGHSGPFGNAHDPAVLRVKWFSCGLCTGQCLSLFLILKNFYVLWRAALFIILGKNLQGFELLRELVLQGADGCCRPCPPACLCLSHSLSVGKCWALGAQHGTRTSHLHPGLGGGAAEWEACIPAAADRRPLAVSHVHRGTAHMVPRLPERPGPAGNSLQPRACL